jgi:hypothetical protein
MSTKMKWVEHHEGLADDHARIAAHHESKNESHTKREELHSALHKATGHKEYAAFAELHRGDAAKHKADGIYHRGKEAFHRAEAEKCSKAVESDMNKVQPTTVSTTYRPGIAIPHPGQPTPPSSPNVDPEFQKLVEVEHVDERSLM